MRALLRLVAVVAALVLVAVLVLLAAGGWRGTGRVAAAVQVHAPAPVVFSHLVQPELLPRWLGGLNRSEPLTEGGARKGARSKEILGEGDEAFEVEVEITRLEPDQLLGVRVTHAEFITRGLYVVKDKGEGGTTLIYEGHTSYPHPMARLFSPVATLLSQAKLEEDLLRLKSLLEAPAEVAAQEAAAAESAPVPTDPELTPSDSASAPAGEAPAVAPAQEAPVKPSAPDTAPAEPGSAPPAAEALSPAPAAPPQPPEPEPGLEDPAPEEAPAPEPSSASPAPSGQEAPVPQAAPAEPASQPAPAADEPASPAAEEPASPAAEEPAAPAGEAPEQAPPAGP